MIGACGRHVHAQTLRPSLKGWVCCDVGVEPAGADERRDRCGQLESVPGWDVAARAGTNRAAGFACPVIARDVHVDRRTLQSAAAEDDCLGGGMSVIVHIAETA